ncbi:uncharacterized protein LOC108903792 isoform X2 [Anoplophora glabripennis]|uniref:uncharacterized protein LOC108903792 isoform X2 n=1 Tax=Anoplophora glabripennis TaxID=217634 RepID=UPI000874567D|nr:uncharacterized protein LOC108903792 isoform X2 [Anoplophora glabripennis]
MRWPAIAWFVVVVAVVVLQGNWAARAAPSPRNEDMFRELLKLDQMYSSIARPSVRSGPVQGEMGPKVQRAINMLRLQELDRLYADRARPRFGKRAQSNSNFAAIDYEGQYHPNEQDVADWLPVRR